jgi:hypothetical protein
MAASRALAARQRSGWQRRAREEAPDISRQSCPSLAMISVCFNVGSASLIFSRSVAHQIMYAESLPLGALGSFFAFFDFLPCAAIQ